MGIAPYFILETSEPVRINGQKSFSAISGQVKLENAIKLDYSRTGDDGYQINTDDGELLFNIPKPLIELGFQLTTVQRSQLRASHLAILDRIHILRSKMYAFNAYLESKNLGVVSYSYLKKPNGLYSLK